MANDEKEFITLCKAQIEEKFGFGNGQGYNERDLKALSEKIENKTSTSISLSTLKRLWKDSFKQSPQIATLNALAIMLDYESWHDFKLATTYKESAGTKRSFKWVIYVLIFLIVCMVFVLTQPKSIVKVNGPVHFRALKTVTQGIPNTVIFNYDVSNVEADSFFIQQSWNDYFKTAIDPKAKAFSSIYYESGYHRAKLYADDSLLAIQPVHIISNGWEPHIYYSNQDSQPIHFKHEKFIEEGRLHLSKDLLEKRQVDIAKSFFSRISYSKNFNMETDNFSFQTRIKVDRLEDKLCPWMQVILVNEKHIFWVTLQDKGCESNASYKLGEKVRDGENSNLALLGVDTYEWQDLQLLVKEKQCQIILNGKLAFVEEFKEDFGKIMGLIYLFDGTGSIDYVYLSGREGTKEFKDDFN